MGLFKTYTHPYTKVQHTNANTIFVNSLIGSDSKIGTRELPVATILKGCTLSGGGKPYILAVGVFDENQPLVGYDNRVLIMEEGSRFSYNSLSITSSSGQAYHNIVGINITGGHGVYSIYDSKLTLLSPNTNHISMGYVLRSLITTYLIYGAINVSYCTIVELRNYTNFTTGRDIRGSIIIDSVDIYNFVSRSNINNYPIFKYCLFRKYTIWKWNGVIITINWNTNPLNSTVYTYEPLLDRVYNSLLFYANNSIVNTTDKAYALAILATKETMFYADANGQTNKVVDDVLYPIFNKYNGTTPIDYSLKLAANNVALTMSDIGGYVGAYKANLNHVQFGTILHVNSNGSDDTVTTPDLLISEGLNQFSASDTSLQLRNRIRTTVLEFPRGKAFDGSQSMLTSGIASRLYFGKYQPMVTTGANPTIPVETIEVIPYDAIPADNSVAQANNLSGKSAFPRFSIMFNGAAEMWYKNNAPLLFNQLGSLYTGNGNISNTAGSNTVTGVNTLFTTYLVTGDLITVGGQTVKVLSIASATSLTVDTPITNANTNANYTVGIYVDKSITEYGDWAVTNADIEDYSLSFKTSVAGVSNRKIPVKFCKLELNLNYVEE